jgi:Cu2+-exporting ATPase
MEQYNVMGMSCAACVTRVEKAVSKVDGVKSCAVSLLTNSMGVDGTASPSSIIKAVEDAGYEASLKGASSQSANKSNNSALIAEQEDMLKDRETPILKKRLIWSVGFLLVLLYFSMGHMMLGFPLPKMIENNHVAMGLIQMLLTIIIMVINQKFFISGFKSLFHGSPNMDALVALGSSAAFVYSTYALFAMTDAQMRGDMGAVMGYMDEFYFESAAMILTLITVGKMLEARSKGKTTDALKSLMKISPKTAVILNDGVETEVSIEEVNVNDIFVVRPGENIPVDGIVIEGASAVNESALTGESIPVDKQAGNKVYAATINQSGFIKCRATRVGEDTTLSQIIKMVSDAAATKAPIAKVADKVSGVFVPTVIVLAVITTLVWLLLGRGIGFALARGISVLVISCPCALGLATPVAIMVGNGIGAKNGIMFKTAVSLEEAGKVNIIALDKTGTITRGEPKVTDVINTDGVTKHELIELAYALEQKSEHPLAKAVNDYAGEYFMNNKNTLGEVSDFEALTGNGLRGVADGRTLYGGNANFIGESFEIPTDLLKKSERLSDEGKTPLFFAEVSADGNKKLKGIISVADVIKTDSRQAIDEFKNMGIHVVMLTGDNERTARAIGDDAGVDEVIAGVLPDGKESVIRRLKEKGKVIMVGDGINDAPALTRADIGMAIGAGTDIAIDAADIVLMKSSLRDAAAAIRLSRRTLTNIHENLFWAFIYNIIGIPLAAGIWIPIFGWQLNPMFAAAAMSLSSFCVVTNALRLNLVDIYNPKRDKKINKNNKEKTEVKTMTKTMKIEGMMCGHCEATVKKALEALPQVDEAVVSHETGMAVVTLNSEIQDDELKSAVEVKDYKVITIN